MTNWEYCQITWIERQVSNQEREQLVADLGQQGVEVALKQTNGITIAQAGYLRIFHADREAELRAVADFDRAMAQLGLEGWELVSHSQVDTPALMEVFYFKRPI